MVTVGLRAARARHDALRGLTLKVFGYVQDGDVRRAVELLNAVVRRIRDIEVTNYGLDEIAVDRVVSACALTADLAKRQSLGDLEDQARDLLARASRHRLQLVMAEDQDVAA